jgi:hypothetical protein
MGIDGAGESGNSKEFGHDTGWDCCYFMSIPTRCELMSRLPGETKKHGLALLDEPE